MKMKLICRLLLTTLNAHHMITCVQVSVDKSRYEEGRREFELISQRSNMPHYGVCWKDAMVTIQRGCKHLTDDVQGRLALAYLNCFLEFQGRRTYNCDLDQALRACTGDMLDADRGSYATFFTHTQNICYFLQAQVWHEATENTIDRLSDSSFKVASKLEDSYELQAEVLKQQQESIKNQETIMEKASNLSSIISASSDNIHLMFDDFKQTTNEQRLLITDVFDRVTKLQDMVLGEFSGFYSVVYYTLSILVSYLLTSTGRTGAARFWLFGLMTLNMILEQLIISVRPGFLKYCPFYNFETEEELVYGSQRVCRKLSALAGLFILLASIYTYKDLNAVNNQLLVEIRKQNSDLRRYILGAKGDNPMIKETAEADSTAVETDSAVSSCSDDEVETDSDHTFILQSETSVNSESNQSYQSVRTDSLANTEMSDIHSELRYLRQSTPIKQLPERVASWVKTGYYSVTPTKTFSGTRPQGLSTEAPRYYLRPRKSIPGSPNPALGVESPRSFSQTVSHLEKIAKKNSILARAMIRRTKKIVNSSDDD